MVKRRKVFVVCVRHKNRMITARVNRKIFKISVRAASMYGLKMVALTQRHKAEPEVVGLKMLRCSLGVTRMDKIRNRYISEGQLRLGALETKLKLSCRSKIKDILVKSRI